MSKKKKVDTRLLFHAVCNLNIIQIFGRPFDDEPIFSQMLFGETCTIIEKKNKHWYKIHTSASNITGWLKANQIILINENLYEKYTADPGLTLEICHPAFTDEISKSIVMGSALPQYDGLSCSMPDNKYVYNGQATQNGSLELTCELVVKIARRYLHSPELSGGRSPFGIDAGALIQSIFRFFDILLPRFPIEQYMLGEVVDFVDSAVEGDLAFCMNDLGQISHVGMVIGEKKVLHVHGCVRIDKLDHFGFYNHDLKKYTHKLRIIKRII